MMGPGGVEPGLRASVVLLTHGRRASPLRVLRALGRQDAPPGAFEVVVVCDGDVDDLAAACRALAPELPHPLCVLAQENGGPAAARAPLIVFLDDVVPDEDLIAAHLKAQAGQDTCVAIGPLLPPPNLRLNAWGAWEKGTLCHQYYFLSNELWPPGPRHFYTGNASVRREHILAAGGFDAHFERAEDVELAYRLQRRGLRFVFLPEARGWHYVRRSFDSWLRLPVAYGAADVMMARGAAVGAGGRGRSDRPHPAWQRGVQPAVPPALL